MPAFLRWFALGCVLTVGSLPASAGAASLKYGPTEYQHHGHIGARGVTASHTFLAFGPIHWDLEWECPAGNYGLHVNLDRYSTFGWTEAWHKIYAYGPPNPSGTPKGAQGSESTHNSPPGEFKISIHAAEACRYQFRWQYTNFTKP